MAQEGYDTLMTRTDSRYRLSMVATRRADQLKHGVPSTLTGKPIARADNAVTVALKELETESGVVWGEDLPSAEDIRAQVQRDGRESLPAAYSVSRDEAGGERVGSGAVGILERTRRWWACSGIGVGVRERGFIPRSPSRRRHPVYWCGGSCG